MPPRKKFITIGVQVFNGGKNVYVLQYVARWQLFCKLDIMIPFFYGNENTLVKLISQGDWNVYKQYTK